jgi:ligand-binding SRPBCC domain-containing protein
MGFERLSDDTAMRAGLEIDYRIRPLLGIPMRWRTRIDSYEPPFAFSDTQLRGPYRRWEHRHTFSSVPGGTLIEDDLTYELPSTAGRARPPAAVRGQLMEIFRYRARTIAGSAAPEPNERPLTVGVRWHRLRQRGDCRRCTGAAITWSRFAPGRRRAAPAGHHRCDQST